MRSSRIAIGTSDVGTQRGPPARRDERADARDELGERERLDDVIIGAVIERGDARLDGVARGEHEDRHLDACAAQLLQHLDAVAIGQAEIENHEIEIAACRPRAIALAAVSTISTS